MKHQSSRREFLERVALLPLGAAVANVWPQSALAAGDSIPKRNPGPKLKLSLNAWSYTDIAKVAPQAINWQVKDLLNDRQGGHIDMVKLVRIIRGSNYRGYVPIETLPTLAEEKDKGSYDAYARVPELLNELCKAIKSTDGQ